MLCGVDRTTVVLRWLRLGRKNQYCFGVDAMSPGSPVQVPSWTFFTNHGHVLVCLSQNPEVRLAEIACLVGIGE